MNVMAVVLARAGSKGLPGKNIRDFCGKPLLCWTIEQALNAKGIHSVWVSSDSDEILSVAGLSGAKIIKRPHDISGDSATSESGWLHAIGEIEKQGHKIDAIAGLQATSPLRETKDIEYAIDIFFSEGLDSLFSAAELQDFFIWGKDRSGKYSSVNYDYLSRKRRQEISNQFVENGSFYIFKPDILRRHNNRLGGKIGIAKMEFWKTLEINSSEDWKMCELLMRGYLIKK